MPMLPVEETISEAKNGLVQFSKLVSNYVKIRVTMK